MSRKPPRDDKGQLVGPRANDKWIVWRRQRDQRIAEPRRLKTCKDKLSGK